LKVLVIGSGGREHALAWKLAQSARVQKVFVAPGNGGTASGNLAIENVNLHTNDELVAWATEHHIGLTVVGPEAPLAAGVVDAFEAAGLRIFGPTQAAAQLESSKAFSKAFMLRHNIPTAAYESFTDAQAAHAYVQQQGAPIVVKADGLAAGKGVVVAMSAEEAHAAVDAMLEVPGGRVVIEAFLGGEEASFIVLSDGQNVCALATSQDHKRLLDGDQGPNTGGMGAYSPAPVVTPEVHARVLREVIHPTLKGMAAEGHPFKGFLYAGLMVQPDGRVLVLEFNTRMGDPETQPILMRLKSDLLEVLIAAADGKLEGVELQWDRRTALGVVVAASGYPQSPRKGDAVTVASQSAEDAQVFHAGTQVVNGTLQTSGGRVLCVTALGDSPRQAQQRAYEALAGVRFDGMQFRKDIGHRAIKPR
jgi:phosphoribosylamine---glycine ligase